MPSSSTAGDGRARPARRGDRPRRGRSLLGEPVVRVGPVSERARLGHRPRGLLRGRRRLGVVPARPRALPRVPLERGRHGRHLGHPPRALPRARALERRGPDPEGADVRPHRAAGEPRRGRQGVLVVPRGAAEPRAAALALPLPAGRLPLRRSSSTTAAASRIPSSSCSTPARSTTTATGRSTSPTRRPRRPRSSPRIVVENHAAEEATLEVLPTLWFRNTWSWGDEAARPRIAGRRLGARRRRPRARRLPARGGTRPRRRAAGGALLRERDERAARLRVGRDDAVPEGRHQRPRRLRRGDRQPGRVRHEGGAPLSRDRARRRQGRAAAAAPSPGRRRRRRPADWARRRVRRDRRRARGGRGRVLRRARAGRHRRRSRCRSCASRAPGSSGASRCTRTTCAAGSTATPASRRRPRPASTGATAAGATSTRSTCSRCRIRGSTRGSRRGISGSTRSPGRTSIRRSRSTSSWCCCASGSSTRTARCRRTSGTSTTSTRRCT